MTNLFFHNMTKEVTEEEVKSLMMAVNNRYGLDFTNYEIKSLKRGIVRLMMKHKLNSMLELWSKVLRDKDFFTDNLDDLTVNLTELFRNPDSWEFIRDKILDKYKNQNKINIWHAGCSTGEEVYSMAILLDEKQLLHKSSLLGTDLSNSVLSKAKEGVYSKNILKNYQKSISKINSRKSLNDYFDFNGNYGSIKTKYKLNTRYLKHNLVDDKMEEQFDIIFCRNVLIYFDNNLKLKVLNLLKGSLKEDGILIIGYYDTMPLLDKEIFEVYNSKTRIYIKKRNIKL